MDTIAQNLITLLFSILTPIILVYVHKIVIALVNKWKLGNAESYEAQVDNLVKLAIDAVEKKAISLAKDEIKMAGPEKLGAAVDWVLNELAHKQMAQPPKEQLAMRVEAALYRSK